MKKRLLTLVMAGVISASVLAFGGMTSFAEETGKHLNVGYHSEITNLDPGTTSWELFRIGVGEALFKVNDNMEIEPWLAESYENVDELTWKITIKDGITFSNGKALDAEAVKACFERTGELNQRYASLLNIASMEADGNVLTIKTNSVNAALISNLADVVATIVDVDTMDQEGVYPVGTGAFVITDMAEGQMELTANENYWGGTPALDDVTIKYITDGNAQAMALDNGEIDLAFQLPTENVEQFKDSDKIDVSSLTGSRSQFLYFDFTNEFLSDINVRKAISMAIDRPTFADGINKGNSEAATAIFPVSFSYGQVDGVEYDLEGAKQLLADAGYTDTDGDGILDKDGNAMNFKLYTYGSHGSLLPNFCEAIQASLLQIGIGTEIQLNDYDPHTETLKAGGFDLALNSYIMAPVADPQYFSDICLKTDADYNYGKYSNEKTDELVAALDAEFDTEKRVELAKEIQAQVVEDCAFLTLGHLKYQVCASKNVSGYETLPTELYLLNANTTID